MEESAAVIQSIIALFIGLVAGGVICFPLGIRYRKNVSEKEISSAEEEGTRIVNEAIKSAESKKREALLEAKEEILKNRSEYEKEVKERRADLQRQENRLQQKEENLDRKIEAVEKKEESLTQKHAAIDKETEEIKLVKRGQTEMLERISGFTTEEAKQYLIDQVEAEVTHETALKIKEVESRMKEECDARAREIARLALEKLISDGRIHPTHIEEMVEKARREVDATIKAEGERVTFECGIRSLHPELVKMLGRLHYRTSYGQNVLQHSVEVSHIAGMMAAELGVDVQAAKRAGLLHDLGKSVDHEMEGTHVALGVEFARKYKEKEDIIHAIEAHHNDVEPRTIVACLVQAADAISAARPGARRENLENYIKRLEQLESITGGYPGVDKAFAIQAGREVRVMVKPEQVSEDQMVILARDLAKKIEEEMEYPGQIKVHVLRETKVVEYAK